MFALEHHTTRAVGTSDESLTDLEASGAQSVGGNGHLMLRGDSRGTPPTVLYFMHECKEDKEWSEPATPIHSGPHRNSSYRS